MLPCVLGELVASVSGPPNLIVNLRRFASDMVRVKYVERFVGGWGSAHEGYCRAGITGRRRGGRSRRGDCAINFSGTVICLNGAEVLICPRNNWFTSRGSNLQVL